MKQFLKIIKNRENGGMCSFYNDKLKYHASVDSYFNTMVYKEYFLWTKAQSKALRKVLKSTIFTG